MSREELKSLALKLYDAGFNVIPVNKNKKPLQKSWSAKERRPRKELEKPKKEWTGHAICGGPANPFGDVGHIIFIDVDQISILEKCPTLNNLISKTVNWKTGPRCPTCGEKELEIIKEGERFKCKKCKTEFTVEKAKFGRTAMFSAEPHALKKYFGNTTKRYGPIEILINNYALIPPSIHPTGVRYEWIKPIDFTQPNFGIHPLTEEEIESILKELKELGLLQEKTQETQQTKELTEELKELNDTTILKIKDILKPGYIPGKRQDFWLYVSGWFAKAKISPYSCAKVLKMLYDETGDTDDIRSRGAQIVSTYEKAGISVDKQQLANILGAEPYGPYKGKNPDAEIAGKSGLQEIFEEALGKEQAIRIIYEMEKILKQASPFNDATFSLINEEAGLYYVNDPKRKRISRWREVWNENYKENTWSEGQIIIGAYIKELKYIENVYTQEPEWEALWETSDGRTFKTTGSIDEHIEKLKRFGVIRSRYYAEDALQSIFQAFLEKGKASKTKTIVLRGFYLDENGKIATDREDIIKEEEFNERKGKLALALETLNEMAKYYPADSFGVAVKWHISAPFNFIKKLMKKEFLPNLAIVGPPGMGKTTLALIGGSIWGLRLFSEYLVAAENISSSARVAKYLSKWTYQILFDNASRVFEEPKYYEIRELLKTAIETTIARGKHVKGEWKETPSLATPVFTIDTAAAEKMDIAEKRRSIFVRVSIKDWTKEKAEEFTKKFGEKGTGAQEILSEIGAWITTLILERDDILEKSWNEMAEEILTTLYKLADMEPPSWIKAQPQAQETVLTELYEEQKTMIIQAIHEYVANIIIKYGSREDLNSSPRLYDRIDTITVRNYPSAIKIINGKICIFKEFLDILSEKGVGITSLKDLADLMKWEYTQVFSRTLNINTKAVMIKPEEIEEKEETTLSGYNHKN
jgi:hypothetical protein